MTAVPREHPEPVDRFEPGTGSGLSAILEVAVPRVREWAGPALEALVLSGSHATGEAAWAEHLGRRVSLSDLDLYAVLRDEAAARAAARRRTTAEPPDAALRAAGLAGPFEVAFVTRAGLARMPASPGTVELVRSGRVLDGDPALLAGLPPRSPAEIGLEERRLLLENRAFELLWAWLAWGPGLAGLRARHAVHKTALELAAARTLMAGELPGTLAERVARARALGAPAGTPSWLAGAWEAFEPVWGEALAARAGLARALDEAAFRREWRTVARAWASLWWAHAPGAGPASDPWALALAAAAREPLRRRLRRALEPAPRAWQAAGSPAARAAGGLGPRLARALEGSPTLRLHGSAATLILAAAQSAGEPALPLGALRALRRLGVTGRAPFAEAAALALAAWGRPAPGAPEGRR